MRYKFAIAISGEVDAPSREHAQQQVLMGVSISGRLSMAPNLETAVTLQEQPAPEVTPVRASPVPMDPNPRLAEPEPWKSANGRD